MVKKNKCLPIGMLFLALGLTLSRFSGVSDLVTGMLYGISIGVLIIGIIKSKKQISDSREK